jgi:outer membrane protein
VPDNPDEWVKLARDRNPQLIVARYNHESAAAATKVQRAAYLPNVDAFGQYNNTHIPISNPNSPSAQLLEFSSGRTTTFGLEATWNIFGGGRTVASTRQASYKEAAAQDQVVAAERNAISSTRTAYLNVAANSYQVDARKQAVKSNESALAATQAGYEVGTRNIVDVLLTESNLFAAKRDYANARYDYVINTLKLKAASGQLSEVDIRDLNNWLDPNGSITSAPEEPAPEPVQAAAPAKGGKKK